MPNRLSSLPRVAKFLLAACVVAGLPLSWYPQRGPGEPGRQAAHRTDVVPAPRQDGSFGASAAATDGSQSPAGDPVARPVSPDLRCRLDRHAQYRALLERIDPAASPGDAVTHALVARMLREREGDAWPGIARAVERWPDDVDVAWLAYGTCGEHAGCDRQDALAHLQRVDGDNAFSWLPEMAAARREGDERRFAHALSRAASAPVHDSRMGTVFLRLRNAFDSMPLPDSCAASPGLRETAAMLGRDVDATLQADLEAMSAESSVGMPGVFGALACRQHDGTLPGSAREDCRAVMARLAAGDSAIEQGVALPTLIELAPDAASRDRWRERYRGLQWLMQLRPEADRIEGYLWRTWAEGEYNVLRRHAESTGRWPPPRDWLPEGERARELLGAR